MDKIKLNNSEIRNLNFTKRMKVVAEISKDIDIRKALGLTIDCKACGAEIPILYKLCPGCRLKSAKDQMNRYRKTGKLSRPSSKSCIDCGTDYKPTSSRQLRCPGCQKTHITEYNRVYQSRLYSIIKSIKKGQIIEK